MTAYVYLVADSRRWTDEFAVKLADALAKAGESHLAVPGWRWHVHRLGTYKGVFHPPFDEGRSPFDLSAADLATHSILHLPETVSFIDIESWVHREPDNEPFPPAEQAYLRAYLEFCQRSVPNARVGYFIYWDGDCLRDPAIGIREHASINEIVTAPTELRVVTTVVV